MEPDGDPEDPRAPRPARGGAAARAGAARLAGRLTRLTVAFVMNRGVEWMAGGSYNLVAVNVPVRFDGAIDHVEGPFSLVVWENVGLLVTGSMRSATRQSSRIS